MEEENQKIKSMNPVRNSVDAEFMIGRSCNK